MNRAQAFALMVGLAIIGMGLSVAGLDLRMMPLAMGGLLVTCFCGSAALAGFCASMFRRQFQ